MLPRSCGWWERTVCQAQPGGEAFSITFEADLTVPEPDQAVVRSWIDRWRDRVIDLRPLDPAPAPDASITALP